MGTRSGLDSQFGFAAESPVGTLTTPTRFMEYDNENFLFVPTWVENEGLKGGTPYKRASRVGVTRKSVTGQLVVKVGTKQFGLLWKHCIGSTATATQIAATTAYKQIHTYVGRVGLTFTVQIARPEPGTGTIQPHTFTGCKVTAWELQVPDNGPALLTVTFDGFTETTATALATATYASAQQIFEGVHCTTFTLGGTVTTTTGVTSIAGGTPLATVAPSFTIKSESPMATDRYPLLGGGVKKEQLENAYPLITGTISAEYALTEIYQVFINNTTTAMEFNLTQGDAGGSNPFKLGILLPAVKFKNVTPSVNGPGLVQAPVTFEAYDDGSGSNPPIQLTIVSTDTVI